MPPNPLDLSHKAILDSLLLKIPGVTAGDIVGLLAYFINEKMFACIWNGGVGIRISPSEAENLQSSTGNVAPFQPKGINRTSEWILIKHENSQDYKKDLEIFKSSIEYAKVRRAGTTNYQ